MSRMKKGNGLLRFLISAVFFALVLSGCNGTRKYEAVDLSSETAAAESESGSGEEQGTENSDEADLQALGNPAGETMSADQAAESSQDAESVSESEEMASEMSEEESVAAKTFFASLTISGPIPSPEIVAILYSMSFSSIRLN